MDTHKLSFGTAIILEPNLAEIIVDNEVEMNLDMVSELHNWISTHLSSPTLMLINKIHQYTYTFEAQMAIGTIKQICAIAVVAYSGATQNTTEMLAALPRKSPWNLKIFTERQDAISWLKTQI